MSEAVSVLPSHLAESSIVTQDELLPEQRWIEAVTLVMRKSRPAKAG